MSNSYLSKKLTKKESPISGTGLFAVENIKKDEIIAVKGGTILDFSQLSELDQKLKGTFLQIEDDFFIGAKTKSEFESSMIGFNHSCEPNLGFSGDIVCVAMRDIKAGEEITNDYGMFATKEYYDFICNCGNTNCRKHITTNDWKNKDLQKKYGKYFSSYILRKME